jgi:hypothetical protein
MERKNRRIVDVRQAKGSVHDFKFYKETIGEAVDQSIGIDAAPVYRGIEEPHTEKIQQGPRIDKE